MAGNKSDNDKEFIEDEETPIFLIKKAYKRNNIIEESDEDYKPEDTETDESYKDDSGKENERKRARKKKVFMDEETLQSIITEIIDDIDPEEDLSQQILKYMQELNWTGDLTTEDIEIYKPIYDKICEEIAVMPKISDILQLSIPYEEKCDIIEKILILNNAQPNTFEFLQLKRHLNKLVEKYKQFKITGEELEKYKHIENSLTFDETKYRPLKYQILDLKISDTNKAFLYQRWKYFSSLDTGNSEYNKLKQWLDCVMGLPTEIMPMQISSDDTANKINKYLWTVKNILDKEIYGLDSVKEKILFLLNNRITNGNSKGLSFAICGPAGTGKTSIIQCLSKAISLPFFQINLGGAKDSSFLVGHSYTYEGAVPGVIVQALTSLKHKNGIIYFDEFDKISNTTYGTELSRMLLHITDFSQNHKFHDRYISNGIDIDLSNIWFVYSLNDKDLIDRTLADRIPIITIDGYTRNEKMHITKNYLIPKALENINLKKDKVNFNDEAIKYIIEATEKDGGRTGVRQIKHIIDAILMKINLLRTVYRKKNKEKYVLNLSFDIPDFKLPINITKDVINLLKINIDMPDDLSYKNMYI